MPKRRSKPRSKRQRNSTSLWDKAWKYIQIVLTIRDIVSASIWLVSAAISIVMGWKMQIPLSVSIPSVIVVFVVLVVVGQFVWHDYREKSQQRKELYEKVCQLDVIEKRISEKMRGTGWEAYLPYFVDHPDFIKKKELVGERRAVISMVYINYTNHLANPLFDDLVSNSSKHSKVCEEIATIRQHMNQSRLDEAIGLWMAATRGMNEYQATSTPTR